MNIIKEADILKAVLPRDGETDANIPHCHFNEIILKTS